MSLRKQLTPLWEQTLCFNTQEMKLFFDTQLMIQQLLSFSFFVVQIIRKLNKRLWFRERITSIQKPVFGSQEAKIEVNTADFNLLALACQST